MIGLTLFPPVFGALGRFLQTFVALAIDQNTDYREHRIESSQIRSLPRSVVLLPELDHFVVLE